MHPSDGRREATVEPILRVTLLGHMIAEDALGQSVLPRSRKTRALLAILALASPTPVLRNRLAALLWSSRAKEQAQGSLRQSVHELQRSLGLLTGAFLRTDRHHVILLDMGLWVDVRVMLADAIVRPHDQQPYQQRLLDDLDGLDPAFDVWLADQREQVARQATALAEAALTEGRDPRSRIAAAERLLTIDRMHERGWEALIRAHLEQGDRTAARLAVERCTTTFDRVGLVPSSETVALFRTAFNAAPTHSTPRSSGVSGGTRLCVLAPRALGGNGLGELLPGLVEEITAAVSRFRWIACVAPPPRRQIAEYETVADYLLDTTVQRSGTRARVILRLLDLRASSNVIWTHRFDREVNDVLTLQAEIAAETAAQIDPELLLREGERRNTHQPEVANSADLTLRAIPGIYRLDAAGFRMAGELLSTACSMDPGNAAAYAWWAYWHVVSVGQAWADDPLGAATRAGELAAKAVTLDPGDARALTLVGHVRSFLHKRPREACVLHERALSLNPNLPLAWCFLGLASSYLGEHDAAIDQITRAQQLSPHDPHAFFFDMAIMMPFFLRKEFDKALAVGRRALELNPGFTSTYKGYLATLGHLQRGEETKRVLARLLALEPEFCVRSALERSPMIREADLELYAEGLRRAGLPEGRSPL